MSQAALNNNTPEHLATGEDMVRIFDQADWPVWSDSCPLPSNERWAALADPHLVTLRVMWLTLTKTKDGLLDTARDLWREEVNGEPVMCKLIDEIAHTRGFLEGLLQILVGAEARLLAASSKLEAMGEFDAA